MKAGVNVLLGVVLAACLAPIVRGQFDQPGYSSPPANASATIDGNKIAVNYYAPSTHERKIFGGLVPFGEVWCTGANWATKLTTPAAMDIGGLHLTAGSYTIWTIPQEKDWTLIINKQTGQFHLDYDASQDVGRTKMNIKVLKDLVETFKIELRDNGGKQGTLALLWEHTEASIPFVLKP